MPIEYRIDRSAGVIEETWTGTVAIQDLEDYWRGYLADADVLALRRTVVDMRAAAIGFSGVELDALVRALVEPALGGRQWLTAIVVSNPVQFGVGRQYHVFAERYSLDAIFPDVGSAKRWLQGQVLEL